MQRVDVLGDDRLHASRLLKLSQGFVRGIWLCSEDPACQRTEPIEESFSIGSSRDHRPDPSERKSGMPEGVEMPAPVSTTQRLAFLNNSAASSTTAS
jgi:hypothetical protein